MIKIPIVVLASGRGSNFRAIHHAIQEKKLPAEICSVISDQPDAPVLDMARDFGYSTRAVPFPQGKGPIADRRLEHDSILLKELEVLRPRFLVLAGYRRILTPSLIHAFRVSSSSFGRGVELPGGILSTPTCAEAW